MSGLAGLLQWYATLTPESLERIGAFYHPQARFRDPFNDVQGVAQIRGIFAHMFATTAAPRFAVGDHLAQGDRAFVLWEFTFGLGGRPYRVQGATYFTFDANGLVTQHHDYWDAAGELWQKLPLMGAAVAWLRRRFAAR